MKLDRVIAVRNRKTVYRDGECCVKVFNKQYSKSNVLNEALNQACIEETGLNVPKILEVTTVEGKWAIVSEYIKGKTLMQLMQENEAKQDEYLKLFVNLHIDIHSKKSPFLSKLKDRINWEICQSDFDATTRFALHTALEEMPRHTKVCHGDFNPSNIIITENGTPYILDWSEATQGSASADVANTYLSLWIHGEADKAKRYFELYCEKSGTTKQYVQKWLPIVAASLSVKSNSQKRELLRKWVDVANYKS